jgi:ubiquinone/menaquinone biosynthesis C-methylase UbiE
MNTVAELKQIFQEGWNIPVRIENYMRGVAEFTEPACNQAWRAALASALPPGERLRVVDMGTGPGNFACLYAQMGHDCTGLDFSQSMLASAARRAAEQRLDCQFIFGDAEEPPLASESFDVVSSRHLLFNLPRPGVALREWAKLLKPSGRMILIGNDPKDDPPSPPVPSDAKQPIENQTTERKRWRATPEYRAATAQCPLFRHGAGVLTALMQALGLINIRQISTEGIQEARRTSPSRMERGEREPHDFFILVGEKP